MLLLHLPIGYMWRALSDLPGGKEGHTLTVNINEQCKKKKSDMAKSSKYFQFEVLFFH